jgi:hypothetical protein
MRPHIKIEHIPKLLVALNLLASFFFFFSFFSLRIKFYRWKVLTSQASLLVFQYGQFT